LKTENIIATETLARRKEAEKKNTKMPHIGVTTKKTSQKNTQA